MSRSERNQLAQQTVEILNRGTYTSASGSQVDISHALRLSVSATRLIRPQDWENLMATARSTQPANRSGRIEVTPETTVAALQRLIVAKQHADVAALNFASAKNPGGGFLGGSQAQEESLARSSGLYATLLPQRDYYEINRAGKSLLYTDHAIYSPAVPVFRDEAGSLLEQPYPSAFITMPAANVGAMAIGSSDIKRVPLVMEHRMNCVFALAASAGMRTLVLGAWGCGVFRNDPDLIASLFAKCLSGPASWGGFFDRIVFAVFDPTADGRNRKPFERHLA